MAVLKADSIGLSEGAEGRVVDGGIGGSIVSVVSFSAWAEIGEARR